MSSYLIEKNIKLEPEVDEKAPSIQFQFTYPHAFSVVAAGFLQKYSYEARTTLTTATGVTQLDEDRFMFYRRAESVYSDQLNYERVIYDRRNGGSITSELIRPRPDGERLFERGTIAGDESSSVHNHSIFDHQGVKTMKVDFFKNGVERVLKAIRFAQFDKE